MIIWAADHHPHSAGLGIGASFHRCRAIDAVSNLLCLCQNTLRIFVVLQHDGAACLGHPESHVVRDACIIQSFGNPLCQSAFIKFSIQPDLFRRD